MARANSPQALVSRMTTQPEIMALPLAASALWLRLALVADADGWLPLPTHAEAREAMAMLSGCSASEVITWGKTLWDAEILRREEGGRFRIALFHGASERRLQAQRANGKLGGRPRKDGSPARPTLRLVSDRSAETHENPGGKAIETQCEATKTQIETQIETQGPPHARVEIYPLKESSLHHQQDSRRDSLSAQGAAEPETPQSLGTRAAVLGEKLAKIAGFPGTAGYNFSEVVSWLSQGVSEATAEQVVRQLTATKLAGGGGPPGSFNYFRRAVLAAAAAERAHPAGAPKVSGNWNVTPKQREAIMKAMSVIARAAYEGWWPKDLEGERNPAVMRRIAKVLEPFAGTEVVPSEFPDKASFERFMARAAAALDEGDAA